MTDINESRMTIGFPVGCLDHGTINYYWQWGSIRARKKFRFLHTTLEFPLGFSCSDFIGVLNLNLGEIRLANILLSTEVVVEKKSERNSTG